MPGFCQTAGVKIMKLCAEYTGRKPDLDESDNSFKVTLYPKREGAISEVEEQILTLLKASAEPLKTKKISDALSIA